jgi:hypothetical protein
MEGISDGATRNVDVDYGDVHYGDVHLFHLWLTLIVMARTL